MMITVTDDNDDDWVNILRVLMPFQRTFRKSLRRFEERVADPSENL